MKIKFKNELNQLIPVLDEKINELFENSKDPKFLNAERMEQMEDMLIELNEIEERFK